MEILIGCSVQAAAVTKYFLPQVFAMFDSKANTSNIQRTLSGLSKEWGFSLQSMWSHLWDCFDFLRSFSIMQIIPTKDCTKSRTVGRFVHHKEMKKTNPFLPCSSKLKLYVLITESNSLSKGDS